MYILHPLQLYRNNLNPVIKYMHILLVRVRRHFKSNSEVRCSTVASSTMTMLLSSHSSSAQSRESSKCVTNSEDPDISLPTQQKIQASMNAAEDEDFDQLESFKIPTKSFLNFFAKAKCKSVPKRGWNDLANDDLGMKKKRKISTFGAKTRDPQAVLRSQIPKSFDF